MSPAASAQLQLEAFPPEILHHVFRWLDPSDLASLPRVCQRFYAFVQGNKRLCEDVYLLHFDTPQDRPSDVDWEAELHDVVKLQVICGRRNVDDKKDDLGFVYKTVDRLLRRASSTGEMDRSSKTHFASRNAELLRELFQVESNREAFLQRSFVFDRAAHCNDFSYVPRHPEHPIEERQQSAKLHCLYGKAILHTGRLRSGRTYPFACSKVYDLREYTQRTRWGPFMDSDDGMDRVDWEKLEAILIVLGNNIHLNRLVTKIFSEVWDSPFSGSWANSYMASPSRDISSVDMKDPYGVSGTWYRVVCFLDYNDFANFNFPTNLVPANMARQGINFGEATRLIFMVIKATDVEPPGPDDGQRLPVVHFQGFSRSFDHSMDGNANSQIRGTVRLTKGGEVRWTTSSIFHGQERWRSEGVQIGGVQSARGVVGNWFDSEYDAHGPAGPTAFWKVGDDEMPRDALSSVMPPHFYLSYSTLADEDTWGMDDDLDDDFDGDQEDDEEMDDMPDEETLMHLIQGLEEDHGADLPGSLNVDGLLQLAHELPGLLMDAEMDVAEVANNADVE